MTRVFDPDAGVRWEVGRLAISQEMLEEARVYQQEMRDLYLYGPVLRPGRWELAYVLRGRRALERLKGRPVGVLHRSLR